MAGSSAGAGTEPSAVGQVIAAVVVVGALAVGLWCLAVFSPQKSQASEPAVCKNDKEKRSAGPVSGAQLCTALNRTDLPTLLGTPTEHAYSAAGRLSTATLSGGTKIVTPEADVTLETYSVRLSASDDEYSVAEMTGLLGNTAQQETVLGHPAVLYSDRTLAISFSGGKADSDPGGIARHLMVARSAKDGGGSFEIAIWRQDDVVPDDAALFRVAERVLPTIPGWTAG